MTKSSFLSGSKEIGSSVTGGPIFSETRGGRTRDERYAARLSLLRVETACKFLNAKRLLGTENNAYVS